MGKFGSNFSRTGKDAQEQLKAIKNIIQIPPTLAGMGVHPESQGQPVVNQADSSDKATSEASTPISQDKTNTVVKPQPPSSEEAPETAPPPAKRTSGAAPPPPPPPGAAILKLLPGETKP